MMTFAFDLISDLHIETWDQDLDWLGKATSPFCIVAGDVARDRNQVIRTLRHLGQCYQAVFYIDGNDEHVNHWDNLTASYQDLAERIRHIPNVVYLQDNVVLIDDVAILATNGWWGFDFGDEIDATQTAHWYQQRWHGDVSAATVRDIANQATNDAVYLYQSLRKLQAQRNVQHVVMVTHTVPLPELIEHDIDLNGTYRFNCMGNRGFAHCLGSELSDRMHTWCFGHYHMPVDQIRSNVRFINNCRGRGDSPYCKWNYNPLRIEVGL